MKIRFYVVLSALLITGCGTPAAKPQADWRALQRQSLALAAQARFHEALALATREADAARAAPPLERASALGDLASRESQVGRYADAARHFQQALDLTTAKEAAALHASLLSGFALNDYRQGRFKAAEESFAAALAAQESGASRDDLATTLTAYGRVLIEDDKLPDAQPLLERALALRQESATTSKAELADTLNQLSFLHYSNGDAKGATDLANRTLALLDLPSEPPRPELAFALQLLGDMALDADRVSDAEKKLRRAMDLIQSAYGPDHEDAANILSDIGNLYGVQFQITEAEDYYRQSMDMYTRVLGDENVYVAIQAANLAGMENEGGQYAEATALLQRSLAIQEKEFGPESAAVANDLSNMAGVYEALHQYPAAEQLRLKSLAIIEKNLPPLNQYHYIELNNLGVLYLDEGRYPDAERYMQRAEATAEQALGPDNSNVGIYECNLGTLYRLEKKYAEAETQYHKGIAVLAKEFGADNSSVAYYRASLGSLYSAEGKYAEAIKELTYAIPVTEAHYGKHQVYTAKMRSFLALAEYAAGHRREAGEQFDLYFEAAHDLLQQQYLYMSEQDRLQYLQEFEGSFPVYFSYCLKYYRVDPTLAGKMYDVLLWEKGLVGQSIAALRAKIAASGDPAAKDLLDKLTVAKANLATLVNNPLDDRAAWQAEVKQGQDKADALERELVQHSGALAREQLLERVTWQDVRAALKPGEAAVEFARFEFVRDASSSTGMSYYVALVMTGETKVAPKLVVLGKAKDLEAGPVAEYGSRLRRFGAAAKSSARGFYQAFWQPLEGSLRGVTRVYLSPDGVLNQAALGIVADPHGRLLMQRYDLHMVPSTRDVVRADATSGEAPTAVLIGAPAFDLDSIRYLAARGALAPSAATAAVPASTSTPSQSLLSRDYSAGVKCPMPGTGILCPLPGAAEEIRSTADLLRQHAWRTAVYADDQALEEAVKSVRHPRVLHLATHGFFLPDQATESAGFEDPMLRSGLYFAGADNTLSGHAPPEGADNGVLTAYEVAQLDLEGTELVVLSACDTGLGTSQSGEGVFGLNRALEEAGARSVMMSMWSVPDQETRELMQLFYANWLGGMDKHEALRRAQLAEREVVTKRYGRDLPYYWGAFVLVGR